MTSFFDTHRKLLDEALAATRTREFHSAFPEIPSGKIYGETAKDDGLAAYRARLNGSFALPGHPAEGEAGAELSPYGGALGVKYPKASADTLIAAAQKAKPGWAAATPEERVGLLLELLVRLNKASFEIANAVMNTTGQAFPMAFQAGGPHAQERGLEALAYAWEAMARTPAAAQWTKQEGKGEPITMQKRWRVVPRGVALMIGCNTFPTWNGYPGLFASLATGNPTIVKPHPMAILPLAITVQMARELLAEAGYDPNVVLLAAEEPGGEIAKELALRDEIALVDYTGSGTFGRWLRENAKGRVFTEESGVNPVVVTGTDDFKGLCRNLAFSLSLYSGQMCTSPQNVFVPKGGIETDEGHKSFDEVAQGIATGIDKLLGDPARAGAVCGALAADATRERIDAAKGLGRVIRASTPIEGMDPQRSATPLLIAVEAKDRDVYMEERFGPIGFVVAAEDAHAALRLAVEGVREKGAITAAIYATDEAILDEAERLFAEVGANLSCNLTGGIYVNQSAAFSDYHATGANPAGNSCLTDYAFVAERFRVAAARRPAAPAAA